MITFNIYSTDKMLSDFNDNKISFGHSKVRNSGKKFVVDVLSGDLESLQMTIDIIQRYGVSSQEDHDDILEEERKVLESY